MSKKVSREFSTEELINILFVVLGALVPVLYTINTIKQSYGVLLFPDEVGYWADAMTFAGHDWSGISHMFPWYSYGYSLLLVPLIKLIKDATLLYRAALILNVVMLEVIYFLWIRIIKMIDSKITLWLRAVLATTLICYPTYVLYSDIALPEIASLFVFTLILFLLIKTSSKVTYVRLVCLGLLGVALYAVHNRNIGIVISLVVVIGIMILKSDKKIKNALSFVLPVIIALTGYMLIKNNLQSKLWKDVIASANEASDQGSKFDYALGSVEGFTLLIRMAFAQLGSVAISTYGVAMIGLYALIRKMICAIKKGTAEWIVPLFLLVSFVLSLGISCLFLIDFRRADQIVYTRYVDTIVGALLIVGILYLRRINDIRKMIYALTVAILPMIIGMIAADSALSVRPQIEYLNVINCPGITRLYLVNGLDFTSYLMLPLMFAVIIVVVAYVLGKKQIIMLSCISAFMIILMLYAVIPCIDWVNGRQMIYSCQNSYIDSFEGDEVYYKRHCNYEFIMYSQYRLRDKKFVMIENDDAYDKVILVDPREKFGE